MNEKPVYYSIITADVRYDKRLTPNAKLLYAEITALTNMYGECYATNKYFQSLYEVSQPTISEWIKQLCDCGYISIEIDKKNNKRYIRLLIGGIKENLYTPLKENLYQNNIINNNIINKPQKIKQPPTLEEINKYIQEKKLNVDGQRFFDYYSEGDWKDSNGKPIRNWKQKMLAVWDKPKIERIDVESVKSFW